ncbi:MAG: L-serine dehydratase, alpha subunit [Candidatus Saccharicenans subterraneus]|uniref:L-serine ammonia-lyase n=1 Tax=Candidatus Saccharicenans subterraneus TaxID=2508984 RepID=A0A3E2BKK5_9BACT|nr:MAG: L-serine dehydratase, alpha subunit [Candidatus Saccharicenans subterraneum]
MKDISIFNQVIGPVMRGPSSSHTAGAYFIGKIARSLLGDKVKQVEIAFDPGGSYARTYREQAADLSFACGIMGIELGDDRFFQALELAREAGLEIEFRVRTLDHPAHPNTTDIELISEKGDRLRLRAASVGGGSVEITRIEDWEVYFTGTFYELAIEAGAEVAQKIENILNTMAALLDKPGAQKKNNRVLLSVRSRQAFPPEFLSEIGRMPGVTRLWKIEPICPVVKKEPIFRSAADMVRLARERELSLGELALEYESEVLGLSREEVMLEARRRFEIMQRAVHLGLELEDERIQLLKPSAGKIFRLEKEGKLPGGGLCLRAAARAMAVMHINGKRGVVCAAPTGGSAGTLPGVLVTLLEDEGMSLERVLLALLAAGAVGVIVDSRATFAAEVAGCQVEIGAAGAMAAAAVVDAYGGNAEQAADASAIAFQNIMGSVCDLVQGKVEIPCHTRNALGAANAFLCAGLIMGGYENPINLDETIDAVYATGKMLPPELRCTALGGLAVCPSALKLGQNDL